MDFRPIDEDCTCEVIYSYVSYLNHFRLVKTTLDHLYQH